jgi:hypothetical protein
MTTPQRRQPGAMEQRPGGLDGPGGPGGPGARRAVERASARPLMFLQQLPRWVLLLAVVALIVAGFAVPGWPGAAALVLVAAFLGWLGYLSWPTLTGQGRLLRVVAVACVLALAVVQARR